MPIIIEGPDGAGKSALAGKSADALDNVIVPKDNGTMIAMEEVPECMS